MSQKVRLILMAAALCIVFIDVGALYGKLKDGYTPQESEISASDKDKVKAADFTLTNLDGEEVSLFDYKGKVIVLNFWASWCPPCKAEMPDFHKQMLAHQEKDDNVVFLMVNLTFDRETEENARAYLKEQGFEDFNVLLDTEGTAADTYSVTGYPSTFFIDQELNISEAYRGMIEERTLTAAIAKLTGE